MGRDLQETTNRQRMQTPKCLQVVELDPLIGFFRRLHLSFTPCNLKRRFIHVAERFCQFGCYYDHTHEHYTLCTPLDIPSQHPIQQLHFPFRADRSYGVNSFKCVDVIHGLVCISYSWSPSYNFSDHAFNSNFLWNPTIHKYVALPRLRLPCCTNNAIGFGYDTSTKDFKVVAISWIPSVASQVYSHRRGSWRTATNDSGIKLRSTWASLPRSGSVFVNGTIHWIISSSTFVRNYTETIGYIVLMFDCESEELRKMDIPKKLFSMEPRDIVLSEHDGMLAAFVVADSCVDQFDVWVMEEHGVSASWNKLYTFSQFNRNIFCDPSYEKLAPYGPNNPWYKIRGLDLRYFVSGDYVYDQNMLLMDHPKAPSYANDEIVPISK